jgi:hypothetical protein
MDPAAEGLLQQDGGTVMDRRRFTIALPCLLAGAPYASAQARRYAVLSLVGDKVEVVFAQPGVGSRIDRNERRAFDDAEGTLDRFVLKAVDDALRRADGGAPPVMLSMKGSSLYDRPDRLFQGRQLALPGAVVDAIEASKVTHLIVLTKLRDEPRVPLLNQNVGTGTVRGLGFYIDNSIDLVDREIGSYGTGLLAPFVYLRLTLVDVSTGEAVRDELVREMETHSVAGEPKATRAWEVLSAEQKVDRLQRLIQRAVGQGLGRLLGAT